MNLLFDDAGKADQIETQVENIIESNRVKTMDELFTKMSFHDRQLLARKLGQSEKEIMKHLKEDDISTGKTSRV